MALFRNPFRIWRRKPRDEAALGDLRRWAIAALGNPRGLELTISEIDCPDPACPGLETFFLVMREGEATIATKIRKPIAEITEADVVAAMKSL